MPQVQLDEATYKSVQKRAAIEGYATVDAYVADVLNDDLIVAGEETPNLDHFFTNERLAQIDAAEAEIEAGNFFTADQAKAELARRREAWIKANP